MIYLYNSITCYVCFTLETPFIAYLLWKWFCFSILGFLFCFLVCFSSMCYTDVCNVLAINVQCYLMPNKNHVMLYYVYHVSQYIAREHWPDTPIFEIGGFDCRVITTEYISRVHWINIKHLVCNALVHVIYFVVSGQYLYKYP